MATTAVVMTSGQPQQLVGIQGQQYVVIQQGFSNTAPQPNAETLRAEDVSHRKKLLCLSLCLIISGLLCIGFNNVEMAFDFWPAIAISGYGSFSGTALLVVGVLGLITAKTNHSVHKIFFALVVVECLIASLVSFCAGAGAISAHRYRVLEEQNWLGVWKFSACDYFSSSRAHNASGMETTETCYRDVTVIAWMELLTFILSAIAILFLIRAAIFSSKIHKQLHRGLTLNEGPARTQYIPMTVVQQPYNPGNQVFIPSGAQQSGSSVNTNFY